MIVLCIYIYIENNVTGFLYGTKSATIVIWMYFLVVIFHVRAASSPVSAFVFVSQIIVYTIRLNLHLLMYIENSNRISICGTASSTRTM